MLSFLAVVVWVYAIRFAASNVCNTTFRGCFHEAELTDARLNLLILIFVQPRTKAPMLYYDDGKP